MWQIRLQFNDMKERRVAGNPACVVKTAAGCLQDAETKSLRVRHITGGRKHDEYKRTFGLTK